MKRRSKRDIVINESCINWQSKFQSKKIFQKDFSKIFHGPCNHYISLYMKTLSKLFSFVCILLLISCTSHRKDFYVFQTGTDSNPGTKNKPFRTIQKAKKTVSEIVSTGSVKDITVWIGGGTYNFDETLVFGPEDSGSGEGSVVYRGMPGESVEFSGGFEIKGWEKRSDGLWSVRIDLQKIGNNDFRELFIDGQRAIRARQPDTGFFRVAEVGKDRRTNFRYNDKDFTLPENPSEVELVLLHDWSISRISLSGIDTVKHVITAKDSIGAKCIDFFNIDNWEKNPRYFLENSMAFLNNEREWYFDKKEGLLYLKLSENASPVNMKVIIPSLANNLLRIAGTETKKIKNIHFENITFSYCSWLLPSEGYAGIQACFFDPRGTTTTWNVIPAAIDVTWSENCSFVDCRFTHLGGSGVWLGTGSVNCKISVCKFEDISGNGIMIGEGNDRTVEGGLWWEKRPDQVASGNIVESSVITACGLQFFGAVGIWCGLTANTSILNNQIFDLPYTGISVGWMWSPVPTPCRENKLEGNHIHHVMQLLSDGGGIYMLGLQPGSRIVNNQIHDIPLNTGRAESNGMFLDEGTTNVEVSGNLIYSIAKSPLRFHKATINLVKNNVLACSGDNPPVRYNNTPVENIVLENNQILHEVNNEDIRILEKAISSRGK